MTPKDFHAFLKDDDDHDDSVLRMWTVYDNPDDYPGHFVARMFEVDGRGSRPTGSIVIAKELETVRYVLGNEMRLTLLSRDPSDDPKIVETWL